MNVGQSSCASLRIQSQSKLATLLVQDGDFSQKHLVKLSACLSQVLEDVAVQCRLHYKEQCQLADFEFADTSSKGSGDLSSGTDTVSALTSRAITVDA